MKFRAVMIDPVPMREFTNIVSTISKLSKECALRLSSDKLYFIVSDENSGPAPPMLWCSIPSCTFFNEYQMIGVDEQHTDIYLAVPTVHLAKALSTLKTAKCIKIKLTKKQCPCLTLDFELASAISQQMRHVTHDIPVSVIPRKLWQEYHEPSLPEPDMTIQVPPLKQLRTTVDRMRSMSQHVNVVVNRSGRFILTINTDIVKVSTTFDRLQCYIDNGADRNSPLDEVSCKIDCKKLQMFLNSDQITHTNSKCSIINDKLIVMSLTSNENVDIVSIIPAIVY